MIGKLKGRIDTVDEDSVIIDVGGVGYHVFCAARTIAALPGKGEAAELIIHTHVREDHIYLFGFADEAEREWFRLLMTVQGVGVKMAVAILGAFSPQEIAHAIAAKDVKSLTRVSGVGPKLAERITAELKDKALKTPTGNSVVVPLKGAKSTGLPPATAQEDAISALVNLGYSRADAYRAVAMAADKAASGKLDDLIKEGLKALARA